MIDKMVAVEGTSISYVNSTATILSIIVFASLVCWHILSKSFGWWLPFWHIYRKCRKKTKEMITEWTTNSQEVKVSSPEDGSAQHEPQVMSTMLRSVHAPLLGHLKSPPCTCDVSLYPHNLYSIKNHPSLCSSRFDALPSSYLANN